jgi:hypothetical protein
MLARIEDRRGGIKEGCKRSEKRAGEPVARAVHNAHQRGVLHGDLKPATPKDSAKDH